MAATSEGTVPFRGYRTWYQVVGKLPATSGRLPLLVLHGGPGFPHDYLEDLAGLADHGRAVVFYDQIGCGKSDHPHDGALWTMATFVEEVAAGRMASGSTTSTCSVTPGAVGSPSSTPSAARADSPASSSPAPAPASPPSRPRPGG